MLKVQVPIRETRDEKQFFSFVVSRFLSSVPNYLILILNNFKSILPFNYILRPSPSKIFVMSRICQITGKVPVSGHTVSHSNIKTKRRFLPNLQTKRYFLAEEDRWITLKLSTEGIRTINKNGLYSVVKQLRAEGHKI